MQLYYMPPSPPCRAVLLLAKLLDIEFDLKIINTMAGEQMEPDFIKLNPQHCVPTVDDDGLVLWESRAILSYLVSAYGKDDTLYPKDIRVRAVVDQRLQFDLGTLYLRVTDYFFPTLRKGLPLDETKRPGVLEAIGCLDAVLQDRTFSAADHFTIADLSLMVTISQAQAFGIDLTPYENVVPWLQRCKAYLEPYDYEEINGEKEALLANMLQAKLQEIS